LKVVIPVLSSWVEKSDLLPRFRVKTCFKIQLEAVTTPASQAKIIERSLTTEHQSENMIYLHADDDDLGCLAILAQTMRPFAHLLAQ
jgi:hypothetical protein